MTNKTLDILEIPSTNQYWLVRADGGKYYSDFKYSNTISIYDNNISLATLKSSTPRLSKNSFFDFYKNKISELQRSENLSKQQISIIAKKLFTFIEEMSIGDIIIVPSSRSRYFLIGIILSDTYEWDSEKLSSFKQRGENLDYIVSNNLKRRNVHWINEIPREKINPKLLYTLTMHQTIINISDYGEHIDPLLSPLYIKHGKISLNLRVNTHREIDSETWSHLYSFINICKNNEIQENITAKANVESPGYILLTSDVLASPENLIFSGIIILAILFGEIDTKVIRLKGIIPSFFQYRRDFLEGEQLKLNNESLQIDNTFKYIKLNDEIKDQKIRDLHRKLTEEKLQQATHSIRSMDLSIDSPTISYAQQKQMDLNENKNEV